MEDVHTYAHLLSVALNSKLCQGAINEAIEIGEDKIISVTTVVCIWVATVYALALFTHSGTAGYRITSRMHDISMELMSLPLLFFAQMVAYQ